MKKHPLLIGLITGTALLIIATQFYPGGSAGNPNSVGYDWADNYISNLLRPLAVNGEDNGARPFATLSVLLLTASFGYFFVKFSRVIKIKSAAFVVKYLGLLATILGFVTVIPSLHDLMVTLSSILTLLIFFYLTIIALKSDLMWLKWLSITFLLTFYFGAYMYFSRSFLEYMPIMQKVIFLMKIIWVLALEYFTRAADFARILK